MSSELLKALIYNRWSNSQNNNIMITNNHNVATATNSNNNSIISVEEKEEYYMQESQQLLSILLSLFNNYHLTGLCQLELPIELQLQSLFMSLQPFLYSSSNNASNNSSISMSVQNIIYFINNNMNTTNTIMNTFVKLIYFQSLSLIFPLQSKYYNILLQLENNNKRNNRNNNIYNNLNTVIATNKTITSIFTDLISNNNNNNNKSYEIEGNLLDTVYGEQLILLLDTWRTLIEDSSLMQYSLAIIMQLSVLLIELQINTQSNNQNKILNTMSKIIEISHIYNFKIFIQTYMATLFQEFYLILYKSVYHDILLTLGEDEENEDEEDIIMRNISDMISSICTIGRISFLSSFQLLYIQCLQSVNKCYGLFELSTGSTGGVNITNNNNNNNNNSNVTNNKYFKFICIQELESLRINILFLTQLIIEDNTNTNTTTNNNNNNKASTSSDTPLIPIFIIDSFTNTIFTNTTMNTNNNADMIITITNEILTIINQLKKNFLSLCDVIKFQIYTLLHPITTTSTSTNTSNSSTAEKHPLYSPLILQLIVQFMSEYIKRYINIDVELYPDYLYSVINAINYIHNSK